MTNLSGWLRHWSRASPNDTDGLTKGWVFNGDNYAMVYGTAKWFSGYDLRRNDWK